MPEPNLTPLVRITFYEHEQPFTTILDDAPMADAYIRYAQLCGYGITLEVVDAPLFSL